MYAELSRDPFAIAIADLPGVTAKSIEDQFRRRVARAIACQAVIATEDGFILPLAYACPFSYEVMFASLHRSLIAVVGTFDLTYWLGGSYYVRNVAGKVASLSKSRRYAHGRSDMHVGLIPPSELVPA